MASATGGGGVPSVSEIQQSFVKYDFYLYIDKNKNKTKGDASVVLAGVKQLFLRVIARFLGDLPAFAGRNTKDRLKVFCSAKNSLSAVNAAHAVHAGCGAVPCNWVPRCLP